MYKYVTKCIAKIISDDLADYKVNIVLIYTIKSKFFKLLVYELCIYVYIYSVCITKSILWIFAVWL